MRSEIEYNDILDFHNQYNQDENNLEIETKIKEMGIMDASRNEDKLAEYKFEFNIETSPSKMYNQLNSHQCNIYAFLRVVKDILRQNTDLDINNMSLSANYINFYDKLEKANALYNELINCKKLSLEIINNKVNRYIGSYGTFHYCREIVNKYGLVTSKDMSELNSKYSDSLAIELLRAKIKGDAISLMDIKKRREKINKKKELMYEVYQFLSRVYGKPPMDFLVQKERLTPLEFKNKYLQDELKDYITVTSFKKDSLFSSYSFTPSIYLNDNEKIMHLPVDKIKEAIIKQLKDNISVWFSSEESTTLDYKDNILDNKLYNMDNLLNIKDISKNKKMVLDMINYDHAMCITGALVLKNEIKQFKVDNSFGYHGQFKGQLIMTNSFLENCVITLIINKKYLK